MAKAKVEVKLGLKKKKQVIKYHRTKSGAVKALKEFQRDVTAMANERGLSQVFVAMASRRGKEEDFIEMVQSFGYGAPNTAERFVKYLQIVLNGGAHVDAVRARLQEEADEAALRGPVQ